MVIKLKLRLKRRSSYGKKNKSRAHKTPGKNLITLRSNKNSYVKYINYKKTNGIQKYSSCLFMSLSKNKKKISRVYGGCLSPEILRLRIIKIFLQEERKIVKKISKI